MKSLLRLLLPFIAGGHFLLAADEPAAGASSAASAPAPSDNAFSRERADMVRQQLRARDITDAGVLRVMGAVPREEFVPAQLRPHAYLDRPLPIGHGQTISQPYIVAFMTQALAPKPADRVLEIGSGSGYQAAVLAPLVREVCTIEIVAPLATRAENTLARLGIKNVRVRAGDGYKGWPDAAPFDAIIVTCAPENVPQPLIDQLAENGRMIIPVGAEDEIQELVLLEKKDGKIKRRSVMHVRFVPMTGKSRGDEK